ncbi:MAG: hypothetical protein JNN05_02160 [Candidatus Omnitrophica bacterium]|nr:hypothetical protein [Candidatus Omnitrophota bacterium]
MVMFLIMGLVAIVALCVIVGLFYFVNNENEKKTASQAIPIVDVSEIKEISSSLSKGGSVPVGGGEDSFEKYGDLASAKSKLANLEKGIAPPANISVTDSPTDSLADPNSLPLADSQDHNTTEKVVQLEAQLAMISQKAIEQAEEAVSVIERLMKENEQLKMNQSAVSGLMNAQDAASFLEMKERNVLLENQLDLSVSKASQLEMQLTLTKKELGQQLLEANSIIARLKMETESQERISQDALYRTSQELETLRQTTLKQANDTQEALIKIKEENLLLKDAKKLLDAKMSVMEDDFKNKLEEAKEIMASLAAEKEELSSQIDYLEKDVSKYRDLNTTLIDKAKILQYELNRHRAQASGLEKVCENFKIQMEEMFQQMEQAKKDNNRLLQERINLEAGVVSLKTENSRLIEKDKTYQQELEKTKEQISRFEKVYKSFQSNIGEVSQNDRNQG